MKYTNECFIGLLVDEYIRTGATPTHRIINGVQPSLITRRFGNWEAALIAAGLTPTPKHDVNITKVCPTCDHSFDTVTYKEATYCSVLCSNVSRRKRGTITRNTREEWKTELRERTEAYKNRPFDQLGRDTQRRIVLEEQRGCCNRCDISAWLGEPLSLEVDHKNGDNADNRRENLEALCPNCHSLTPTWRGRNKRIGRLKITDEELKMAIKNSASIRQALMVVGMSPKGQNYRRAKRLALEIELEE